MNRRWRPAIIAGVSLAGVVLMLGLIIRWVAEERVTTCRLSPDETCRVWLVDLHINFQLDRNFSIRLERFRQSAPRTEHTMTTLLRSSADEGRPEGSERFVWSKDGTKVLLVGRHFYVRDDLMLDNGDQVYFLHDLKSGRSWINTEHDRLPALTADLFAGAEFTEPVILQPRAKVDPDSPANRE